MEKQVNRRRFYRFMLSPHMQLKYGAYYAGIASSILFIWGAMAMFFMFHVLKFSQGAAKGMTINDYLMAILRQHQWMFAGGFVISAMLFLGLAFVMTERIVGPSKALLKHVDALKDGNYEFKTNLRKNDELKPLMVALNELSETLQREYGNRKPAEAEKTEAA